MKPVTSTANWLIYKTDIAGRSGKQEVKKQRRRNRPGIRKGIEWYLPPGIRDWPVATDGLYPVENWPSERTVEMWIILNYPSYKNNIYRERGWRADGQTKSSSGDKSRDIQSNGRPQSRWHSSLIFLPWATAIRCCCPATFKSSSPTEKVENP